MHLYTIGSNAMLEARCVRSSRIVRCIDDHPSVFDAGGDERRTTTDFSIIVGGLEELSDEHIRMLVSEHRMCRQLLQFLEAPTVAVEFLAQDP